MGVVGQCHALAALLPQQKAPVSMVLESGWTLWLVWAGVKKEKSLVPTGI